MNEEEINKLSDEKLLKLRRFINTNQNSFYVNQSLLNELNEWYNELSDEDKKCVYFYLDTEDVDNLYAYVHKQETIEEVRKRLLEEAERDRLIVKKKENQEYEQYLKLKAKYG